MHFVNIYDRLVSMSVCPCIEELLASIVAAEALEHNYTWQAEGKIPQDYDEFLANIGLAAWLGKIEEKCKLDTSGINKIRIDALDTKDKAQAAKRGSIDMRDEFRHAKALMTDVKMQLFELGIKLCKEAV